MLSWIDHDVVLPSLPYASAMLSVPLPTWRKSMRWSRGRKCASGLHDSQAVVHNAWVLKQILVTHVLRNRQDGAQS